MRLTPLLLLVPLLVTATPAQAAQAPRPVLQTRAFVDDPAATPANADADDPAIWVDRADPARSLVLGTLKEGGLAVFDLRGREVATLPAPPPPAPGAAPGRFNNVDVLGDLAVVSDRGRDRIRVYRVDPRRQPVLTEVTDPAAPPVFSADESEVDEQRTAYGLSAAKLGDRRVIAVSRRHETRVALLELVDLPGGRVGTKALSTVDLPDRFPLPDGTSWTPCAEPGERPQVEGMALDAAHGVLYAAQEDVGIWRIPLGGEPVLMDKVRSFGAPARYDEETEECVPDGPDPGFGGTRLTADAEGLTIAEGPHGTGQLYASSQGDSRFVVYDRTGGNRVLSEFSVGRTSRTDSVEHSDGAAVTTTPLPGFPRGLLVLHDGERRPEQGGPTTGFVYLRR
ncbi:phytase [Amycolatopsis magusensis]|uniref:3-phytase n=2 Tax=Amycolatopsis magusensis TaxID=882444 RepID=A0ABS4Q3N0_9PSEU|nr:phytase [Amycolatopsis magusensis]MBP2186193.1 3-phytase [Amycolatopsis magusensis]